MQTPNPFDPQSEYDVPKGDSKYLKFEKGETEFLPLSSPIIGWEYWNHDNKPVRLREQPNDPANLPGIRADRDENETPRYRVNHFWAFPVIDCSDGKVKILEITQKTIQNDIRAYAKNAKWGSPTMRYSFTVSREGDKFDTKYTVMANPAFDIPEKWLAEWQRVVATGFNLEALFDGDDPFTTPKAPESPQTAAATQLKEASAPAPETATDATTAPKEMVPEKKQEDEAVIGPEDVPFPSN